MQPATSSRGTIQRTTDGSYVVREVDAIFSPAYNPCMSRVPLALPILFLAAACGPGRTSARLPPGPPFDPAQSDPEALAIVDAGVAALGGAEAWDKVQQLSFEVDYKLDGVTQAMFVHHWDRWNGRHYFATPVPSAEDPAQMNLQEVKHDLFDADAKPWAAVNGTVAGTRDQADEMAKVAKQRLKEDLYFIAMIHKLKDPGVKLTIDNAQITVEGSTTCQPSCTSVKVSFDPAVGSDTWYANFNNDPWWQQSVLIPYGEVVADWIRIMAPKGADMLLPGELPEIAGRVEA